jgi:hypothetical protein
MPAVRIALTTLVALACPQFIAAIAHGAELELVVQLASGRQFKGAIDPTSTAEQLVLRTTIDGITLRRPIRWERVARATVDGQPAEVARLRDMAAKVRVQGSEDRGWGTGDKGTGNKGSGSLLRKIELRGEAPSPAKTVEPQLAVETTPPRVAMVASDPYIANWDADIETDGLVIDIMPLDINRCVVPSSGTLEVELFAPQRRTLDLAPMSGGDTLELVERWTRAITPEDFGPSGVRLRLPFGAITPELQPNWTASWYGLVHVRLAIPGQGVFEDSRDGVRIRPWAPNRDRLEMKTGQRFLSTENLGRRE